MTSLASSGIIYAASCADSSKQLLGVQIQINGPFEGNILELAFPRWVPGSYFIREPIRFMQDIIALDSDENEIEVERFSHNRIRVKIPNGFESENAIRIRYKLLSTILSVRSNHLDSSHLHLMPPFTWMEVTKGISEGRVKANHHVVLGHHPSWSSESQMPI
ncbi:MAG: hypothetical protein VX613_05470, partial [Candidatus Thermoplasmatota archaeon]|nr:hypothetical protein [Candidatus Thermoplasmatota archaeon]